jgi:hypothetical protein
MTLISSTSQNLQQGLTNPKYLRVINKTYLTKRKYSKGHEGLKERLKQEVTFGEKLTMSESLLSMF